MKGSREFPERINNETDLSSTRSQVQKGGSKNGEGNKKGY